MTQDFTITLSQSEMLAAASALGYESIFLLSQREIPSDPAQLKAALQAGLASLEGRGLTTIELDGTLQIRRELQAIVLCLCEPTTAAQFTHNLSAGRKTLTYLLQSQLGTLLAQALPNGDCHLRLTAEPTPETVFPEAFPLSCAAPLQELLTLQDARYIRSAIEAFDHYAARQTLLTRLNNAAAADRLLEIFSATSGYLSIRVVRLEGGIYKTVRRELLSFPEGQPIRIYSDRDEAVSFQAVDGREFARQILAHFSA